ncbi:MAG: DNA cytosine methyltransferase [Verrucomicrobia bacterium]|nr:DNA cytosine methyltransferase [Verrucomicrobiota bacterium]
MIYYNEHDPKAAAWLRELIAQGHLPPGHVDTRDIQLVQPDDLVGYTQCHFFAGIGGWALGLLLAGVPNTTPLWTGSCPCQPFSVAGKGLGTRDPRHLWPHFRRLIRLCRPPVILGEQVASAAGRDWLSGVCADLEALAYRTAAADLCAAGGQEDCTLGILRGDQVTYEPGTLSAPHIRQRLWWCAGNLRLGQPHRPRWQPGRTSTPPTGHGNTAQPASNAGGVDHAGCPSHESDRGTGNLGRPTGQEQSQAQERQRGGNAVGDSSQNDFRLGTPQSGGCGELRHAPQPGSGGHAEFAGGAGLDDSRLAVTHGGRCQNEDQQHRHERQKASQWETNKFGVGSAWSHYDLIPCRDGKTRRIESGTFPLAHGVPGRVGLLRGYGNAIVSERAADFILCALEALQEIQHPESSIHHLAP